MQSPIALSRSARCDLYPRNGTAGHLAGSEDLPQDRPSPVAGDSRGAPFGEIRCCRGYVALAQWPKADPGPRSI